MPCASNGSSAHHWDAARCGCVSSPFGINFPDLLMTRGEYQFRPDPSFTPGLEVAGEVIESAGGFDSDG